MGTRWRDVEKVGGMGGGGRDGKEVGGMGRRWEG